MNLTLFIVTWIMAGILACILWYVNLKIRKLLIPMKKQLKWDLEFLLFLIITGYASFLVTVIYVLIGLSQWSFEKYK